MAKLPFDVFSKWLNKRFKELDAEVEYKKIGGKLPEKKKKATDKE